MLIKTDPPQTRKIPSTEFYTIVLYTVCQSLKVLALTVREQIDFFPNKEIVFYDPLDWAKNVLLHIFIP